MNTSKNKKLSYEKVEETKNYCELMISFLIKNSESRNIEAFENKLTDLRLNYPENFV